MRTLGYAATLLLLLTGTLTAQTVIVDDDFESYANDNEFYAVWEPRNGPGDMPAPGAMDQGILDDGTLNPDAYPGDGMGGLQGVDHIAGAINQHTALTPDEPIHPTAEQSIFLSGDVYDDANGNKRMSIGLRSRSGFANFLELGFWNANTCDPTAEGCDPSAPPPAEDPTFIPGTAYAYRLLLFGELGGELLASPNWQFFQLPIELDRPDDADELVSPGDVGPGWHRYTAEISESEVTLELDLFRDGMNNGTNEEGVDASVTWQLSAHAAGFDSFRIGGASGLSSAGGGVVFDNILLELRDVEAGGVPGDYNEDGTVNAADYVVFRNLNGQTVALPNENPDAMTPGMVDAEDYTFWAQNFGSTGESGSTSAIVPEPSTVLFAVMAIAGLATGLDRRWFHA